ncbi:unnamed protein product [Polarella glacialis]|uniref:Uncharacterized protein n=1 Tax=Polarella glacialis TaxID=89957 RepID=A0A813LEP3_POLGL|nr:unnamed protein product [Polarella glacialis]
MTATAAVRLCVVPEALQLESVLRYDPQVYCFSEILTAVISEPPGSDLSKLHLLPLAEETLRAFRSQVRKAQTLGPQGNPWNRRFQTAQSERDASSPFQQFASAYHDLLRYVVLDDLGTDCLAFQAKPTFRCHLPYCGAPGRAHRDEDYHHPICEVNYWVPVTQVFGSNSLYAETSRGAADFHAFELLPGEMIRFYGNQVWHYTLPNETESTRVSFDFRVLRVEEWCPSAFASFQLGGYYSVMTREGLLKPGSPELQRLRELYSPHIPENQKGSTSTREAHQPASLLEHRSSLNYYALNTFAARHVL